jgi:hypothetical protein
MNWFTKKADVLERTVVPTKKDVDYASLSDVEKIHYEFDIASEKALKEANRILAEAAKSDVDKAKRLSELGFSRAQKVEELSRETWRTENSQKKIELIERYRKDYPDYKFIPEDMVEDICKRYGLVCSTVNRYKADVPLKNVEEIEAFRSLGKLYSTSIWSSSKWSDNDRDDNGKAAEVEPSRFKAVRKPAKLYICAPKSDMDLSGLTSEYIGSSIYTRQKEVYPDPIVLHRVEGGFIIVTKWGPEAEIKELK